MTCILAMINFALFGQPTRTGGNITIYLRINKDSQKIRMSTKITVPARNWNAVAQSVVKGGDFDLAFYREKLTKIVNTVESVIRTANLEEWELDDVQRQVGKLLGAKEAPAAKGVLSLYKEWSTVGTAQKKVPRRGDRYSYNVFAEFVGGKDLPYNKVDYTLYNDYLLWLRNVKKYKENTVGTHIKNLKAVMNEAYKRNLHSCMDFQNFHKPQENIVNVNLNEGELQKIYRFPLSGSQERARDIFMLGCYVAQRHSDYSRISSKDINGDCITVLQKKTGRRIVIPLHPVARAILNKYNGVLPSMPQQVLNRQIKEVAKNAGINEMVQIRETKAGKTVERYLPKWELITSHTARKSGVTNALRAGVPIEDCMYLAGIRNQEVFRKYVGISDDEYTARLANSRFFTGSSETEELIEYAIKVIRSGQEPSWLKKMKGAYRNSLKK